jgi:type I restriction enzyme S subunit
MFGDPVTNPMGWEVKPLSENLNGIRYGTSTPPPYSESGFAFIRATNIKKGRVVDTDMKFITEEDGQKIEKCRLIGGEIIIVRSGVNTGDTCVVPAKYAGHYAGYDIIIEPDSDCLDAIFLNELINTSYMEIVIKPLTARSAQPHLNAEQVKSLPIIQVPIDLQTRFADFVKQADKSKVTALRQTKIASLLYNNINGGIEDVLRIRP